MTRLGTILLVAVLLLQTWLALILLWQGTARRFRFFSAYTIFAIVAESAKLIVHRNFEIYYYVYVATQPLYALLGYLAIAEVFHRVFKNFYGIRWFKLLFPAFGVCALLFSVLLVSLHPPLQATPFLATVFVFEIVVRCLQLGVFFLIFGLANFFNLLWRQYSFGITSGFGLAASGILVTMIARSLFGTKYAFVLQFVPSVTYLCAVIVWLVSLLKPLPSDPLQDFRPLFTPEGMRELYERYKRLTREIFGLCLPPS